MSQRLLLTLALSWALAAGGPPAATAAADPGLTAWRAARRAEVRRACLGVAARRAVSSQAAGPGKTMADPALAPAHFGLLVIPVDFADERLPAGWDPAGLAPRLGADSGQSLRRYFAVASASRCELVPVLAPLVRLPGAARDYSDIGLNGFSRSRRLAREALAAVAAAGFDLGLADLDGPDGLPRSGDDDGWVDGVLLLHAEAGQENDPENGRVQALQYYLEAPVTARGVNAGAYAVASLHSGPGIWAHETAHLLGLEDRYDPLLPPATGAGDIAGAGGLGVFSLMAAGALGTGGGWQPSLPDAYSRALLGWCDVATITDSPAGGDTLRPPTPAGGRAHRAWTADGTGPEFLLLEARDPAGAAPFDAALPGAGLVVLHIDEGVPEGGWTEDGPGQWHLRARLVEADGSDGLRRGDDSGTFGDLYPGAASVTALTPASAPPSDGYGGPSGVSVTGIAAGAGFWVHHTSSAAATWLRFEAAWSPATGKLSFAASAGGVAPAGLSLRVETVGAPAWGTLEGGEPRDVALAPGPDGRWRPVDEVRFVAAGGLPAGAATRFRYTLTGPGVATTGDERDWVWSATAATLDFGTVWPGEWVSEQPDGPGTAWLRWTGPDSPAAGLPVLACTGASADPAAWPDVSYTNGGRARLTSGPLGPGVAGVRLLHWVDVETLPGGVPMDGATASWVAPDGTEVVAAPLGGWPARVDGSSGSALRGRGSFGREPGELGPAQRPVWRSDVIPLPGAEAGAGPWRLRLELAANALWRGRGWLVADIAALSALPAPALAWGDALAWDWPVDTPPGTLDVEARVPPDSTWVAVLAADMAPVPAASLLPRLPGGASTRHEVRVTGPTPWGRLALGPVTVYVGPRDAAALGEPWPNPATGDVRLTVMLPPGAVARLEVHDLRGRRVHTREVAAGTFFIIWDGRDDDGRRLPSGSYILRLSGAGPASARKVVLAH